MLKRLALIAVGVMVSFSALAADPQPIKIGEISETKIGYGMAENQRRGFLLALDQINARGGVLGRPLQLLSRDGGDASPEAVLRDAADLVEREGARLLLGTGPDNGALAVSAYAKRNGVFYLKTLNGTNKHIWQEGHDLAFRFDVSNYMFGAVFAEAAAKLPARRWAFIAPDYEFGHAAVADFQKALKARRPDVQFLAPQWHPMLKVDAAPLVRAVKQTQPDAIFIVSFATDAVQILRAGRAIHLFEGRDVISVLAGQPEQLAPLGKEAPVGWITQGYPFDSIEIPAHKAFLAAYRARYHADPGWCSFVGYNTLLSLARAIEKAGSDDPRKVAAAMKGMTFDSAIGPLTYRAADNQSNLGLWVGKIGFKNDKPALVDWTYEPGDKFYPGDAFVKTVRPATP